MVIDGEGGESGPLEVLWVDVLLLYGTFKALMKDLLFREETPYRCVGYGTTEDHNTCPILRRYLKSRWPSPQSHQVTHHRFQEIDQLQGHYTSLLMPLQDVYIIDDLAMFLAIPITILGLLRM